MNKEQLRELQDELQQKQAFEYAVGAFSYLVQTYDVKEYVKDLPINRLPSLIAKVEEAIVQAVKEFAQVEEVPLRCTCGGTFRGHGSVKVCDGCSKTVEVQYAAEETL